LYPQDSGNTLDLTEDLAMSTAFIGMVKMRAEIESRKEIEDQLKQKIQQRMAEASKAIFRSGSVSWKRSKSGSRRFLINAPSIAATEMKTIEGTTQGVTS
jgi:hypothetical protein